MPPEKERPRLDMRNNHPIDGTFASREERPPSTEQPRHPVRKMGRDSLDLHKGSERLITLGPREGDRVNLVPAFYKRLDLEELPSLAALSVSVRRLVT